MSISGIGGGGSLTGLLQTKAQKGKDAADVFEEMFEEKSVVQEQQDEKREKRELERELFDPNGRAVLEEIFRESAYGWQEKLAAQLQKDDSEEARKKDLAIRLEDSPDNPDAPANKLDSDPNPIKSNQYEDLDSSERRTGRKSLNKLQESGEESAQEVASPLFGAIDSEMDFMEMLDKMDLEKAPEMQENVRDQLSKGIMRKNGMTVPNELGMNFTSTQDWLKFKAVPA